MPVKQNQNVDDANVNVGITDGALLILIGGVILLAAIVAAAIVLVNLIRWGC